MPDTSNVITLDGEKVSFTPGETLLQIADRNNRNIPTLCYDPRLEAFGGCRLCVVEVEGWPNLVASCTTEASQHMVVTTNSNRLEKHRRVLLEMVASEVRDIDVDPLSGYSSQEFSKLVARYGANTGRFRGRKSGETRADDPNPFILRDYENCIYCYRCVRVCAEQEGDHAISVKNRGFSSQISVEFDGILKDSECTFCGQCVQTCPTGALADKKALGNAGLPGQTEKTRTVCPYCGVGCSVDILTRDGKMVAVQPAMDGPANEGALCVKGQFAWDFVQHPDRLNAPMVRNDSGELERVSWDEALDRAAAGFKSVVEQYGADAIYGIASGRAPNEAAYAMQKFMRAGWGLNNIDHCARA
jgi:NADH-quinone oxidoreductase subunit G